MTTVRESRAGDDFHLLWAARRALALVDPRSSLSLVRLEGLNPADAEDGDDRFLGVDLTEYYGGESLQTGSRVVVSQLKYSVRHPDRKWTTSRVTTPTRARGTSVVRRLANIFGGLVTEAEGDLEAVVARVRIRLVSNQPVASELRSAIDRVQSILAALPVGAQIARATTELTAKQRASIDRLQARSGLSNSHFAGFLRVLDLSGCGSESRALQRLRISEEVGRLVVGPHTNGLPALVELVRQHVLPEAATLPGIRRAEVLAALGAPTEEDLLPAPPRFEAIEDPISTAGLAAMAACVLRGTTLVHARAGIGKTTTLLMLEPLLPPGSVVIPYDCFGGGDYLSPGEERHTAGRALVQLANELSVRLGIAPLLYSAVASEADLWRRFGHRLAEAADVLVPHALFVIAIDAADNAVFAASRRGERSFVEDLWNLALPDNTRFLMTCRTHRRNEVRPPPGVVELELQAFDENASTAMLRRRFPKASDQDGSLFHRRTGGVPRVQSYLLSAHQSDDVTALLARSEKGLGEIFDDVLHAALVERADRATAERQIATVFAMTRPVRLATMADVLEIDLSVARDIASSLEPGVVVVDDCLHFPDEDFEHHLRDRVSEEELRRAHNRLCDYYLARCADNQEAAAAVAEHLREAGRDEELVQLALEEPLPTAVRDGLARSHTGRRRLRLAIEAASRSSAPEVGVKLVLLAAELARSDTSLTDVIRTRPELASRFADAEAIAAVYLRQESDPWLGPAHFRVASVLAWHEGTKEAARDQLTQAHAWVQRWMALSQDARPHWDLTADDLGHGAAAVWGLAGAESAEEFLSRWRPPEVLARAIATIAAIVARHERPERVARSLMRLGTAAWVQAQFVVALSQHRKQSPRAWVDRVARRIVSIPGDHAVFGDPPEWGVAFCEVAIAAGVPKRVGKALLTRLAPPLPTYAPSEYDLSTHWRDALRAACLSATLDGRELAVDDLLPAELRPPPDRQPAAYDSDESKRRSFREALAPLLPIYALRTRSAVGAVTIEDLATTVSSGLQHFRQGAGFRWYRERSRFRAWATLAVESLINASGDASTLLGELVDVGGVVFGRTASFHIQLAAPLVETDAYRDLGLGLLDKAAHELSNEPYSASERRDLFLEAAEVALAVDELLAGDYFASAVDAAQGIDDSVGLHLAVLARLAMDAVSHTGSEEGRALGDRLARSLEAVAPYVSDPSEILPYSQVVLTVTDLDPASAFALTRRWDDEDRVELSATFPIVVEHACRRGWLEPEAGLWLLRLTRHDASLVDSGIALLDVLQSHGPTFRQQMVTCFSRLAEWVQRDTAIHDRASLAKKLTSWAARHNLQHLTSAGSLLELQAFVDSLHVGGRRQPRRPAFDASDVSEFQLAPSGYGNDLVAGVRHLLARYADQDSIAGYLTEYIAGAGPRRRIGALDEVVRLATECADRHVVVQAVAAVLREAVEEWQGATRVQEWAGQTLPAYLERHLPRLFAITTSRWGGWRTALQTPFELTTDRLPTLLNASALRLDELSATELFAIAEACAQRMPLTSRATVVEWALERVAPIDSFSRLTDLPTDPSQVVATFLWSLFGHPDKRVRWRAAHSTRGLLTEVGDVALVRALVHCFHAPPPVPFRASGLDFFLFSAQMWALLVFARVAGDAPDILMDYEGEFAAIATDTGLPHAASRELARRIALRLSRHTGSSLPATTVEALRLSNRPRSCATTRRHGYELSGEPSYRDITRFHFDTMDTTRYWYEPLARVFGLHTDEITRRADKWVTDTWARTHEECNRDERRDRRENEWQLLRNDHGSMPLIETLRTYLEYHAMLVVAGELLDEGVSVVVEPYDDPGDPWQYWLRPHLDTDADCWLADRRAPTPLEPYCFGVVPDRTVFEGSPRTFDELLGEQGSESLNVSGWIHTSDDSHYVHLHVMSALVSPESAAALLRALQTTSPYRFQLPYTGEGEGFHGHEIDQPGFQLLGWLDDIEVHWTGLDDHDPLSIKVAGDRTVPGEDFREVLDLTTETTGCRLHRPSGEEVVRVEIWSDEAGPGERHEIPRSSEGRRTWVRRDALLAFLRHRGLDLVIAANVSMLGKSQPSHRADEREGYGYEESRIYVLRRAGTLERLPRHPGVGSTNRGGTPS